MTGDDRHSSSDLQVAGAQGHQILRFEGSPLDGGARPNVMRWNGPLRQHLVLKRGRCSNATKEGPFHEVC